MKLDQNLNKIEIGKAEVLKEGKDLLLLAVGSMVKPAENAAEILEKEGISASVINARFIKPLDEELIIEYVKKNNKIITIEEQALKGGFGSAVLELLNDRGIKNYELKRMGIPDNFVLHGDQDEMRSEYNLDQQGIIELSLKFLNKRPEVDLWPKKNA